MIVKAADPKALADAVLADLRTCVGERSAQIILAAATCMRALMFARLSAKFWHWSGDAGILRCSGYAGDQCIMQQMSTDAHLQGRAAAICAGKRCSIACRKAGALYRGCSIAAAYVGGQHN